MEDWLLESICLPSKPLLEVLPRKERASFIPFLPNPKTDVEISDLPLLLLFSVLPNHIQNAPVVLCLKSKKKVQALLPSSFVANNLRIPQTKIALFTSLSFMYHIITLRFLFTLKVDEVDSSLDI